MNIDTSLMVVGIATLSGYVASKGTYRVIDDYSTFCKIMNEGLYHFTSLENCAKIIESGHIKASSKFTSYSNTQRSFFFAGIPSFEDMGINCSLISSNSKLTAVKIKPTFEQLAQFKSRKFNDNAIVYDGNCRVDDKNVSIAYLVTDLDKDGHICYKEVDKKTYDEYIPSKEFSQLQELYKKNRILFTLKALKADMLKSYEKCTTIINNNLHKMHLIKDNMYSNKPLKEKFNLQESIKDDIRIARDKLMEALNNNKEQSKTL